MEKNKNWFIKNKIIVKNENIFIETKFKKQLNKQNILIDETVNLFYYARVLVPIYEVSIIRKQILENLPNIKVNDNELFIYIRSGDIFFGSHPHSGYIQPPFCFYKTIFSVVFNYIINIFIVSFNF